MGKEKKVVRREKEAPPLIHHLLLSSSQIISRRAGYLPHFSLCKCQVVLSRPHKIGGSCSLGRSRGGAGQVGDEGGKEGQLGWLVPAPFILVAPYLPEPPQRSLIEPGSEQGMCQC